MSYPSLRKPGDQQPWDNTHLAVACPSRVLETNILEMAFQRRARYVRLPAFLLCHSLSVIYGNLRYLNIALVAIL